jgi:hypothetical protein
MSETTPYGGKEEEDPTLTLPDISIPYDLRPDLSDLGLIEHERGVCEDTYENRAALRRAHLNWDPVYDQMGAPTGLIVARSEEAMKERRVMSLAEKRPLLLDASSNNSDYLTGLDLLLEDSAVKVTPPWVIGATKAWLEEQRNGVKSPRRAPASLPHRCRTVKTDGIRCMLWSSGRVKDDGLCRVHLRTVRRPGADIERARAKLVQSAPYAVDVLEDIMENGQSEPARLKAATEILDRAGVRGGVEMDIGVDVQVRSASDIVQERLQRLALGAIHAAASLPDAQIVDAEPVIEDSTTTEETA